MNILNYSNPPPRESEWQLRVSSIRDNRPANPVADNGVGVVNWRIAAWLQYGCSVAALARQSANRRWLQIQKSTPRFPVNEWKKLSPFAVRWTYLIEDFEQMPPSSASFPRQAESRPVNFYFACNVFYRKLLI
ncbi:MAG: hypothetical protein ABR955_13840 [Verrucomicrobiota bacterium]